MSHLFGFIILSNECDNQLYIVMVRLNTALPKQGFVVFQFIFYLLNDNSKVFLAHFCFLFGSAYLLYIVHTQGHFHYSQSVSCSCYCSITCCFSWFIFTNTAGITQQRVPPSPFGAVPLGFEGLFWSFFSFESKGTDIQLTIASWGALSALRLITWKLWRGVWRVKVNSGWSSM